MNKTRLDVSMVSKSIVISRSQAESYIKLGHVKVNGKVITKAGQMVGEQDKLELTATEQYVSRAGLKLASVAGIFNLDFNGKVVLDVGSSTGGFTDYALQHGAKKVIAVDVGTEQLHPSLRTNPKVELHEKTDIRDFKINEVVDIVIVDVSFISLGEVMPAISKLMTHDSLLVAMAKPQFEVRAERSRSTPTATNPSTNSGFRNVRASSKSLKHKGVIKNDSMRRDILNNLEKRIQNLFIIVDKRDSGVAGAKGNKERFYLLKPKA